MGDRPRIRIRRHQEDGRSRVEAAGARSLRVGDAEPLGRDIVHSVTNPIPRLSGSVLDATAAACTQAVDGLFGRTPLGFLAFDCIARRGVLGDEGIRQEVARITSFSRGAPVAGFYTYGEIARTQGISGFHNETLVVLAVS